MVVVLYPVVFARKIILYRAGFNPIGGPGRFCRQMVRGYHSAK